MKKGASTNHFTGLQAIFPVLALTLQSRLANEVLPPLKKGASTDHFTGIQAIFLVLAPALQSWPANAVLPLLKKGARPTIPLAFKLFFRFWRQLSRAGQQPMRCCLP
jgi:hypothetical protein